MRTHDRPDGNEGTAAYQALTAQTRALVLAQRIRALGGAIVDASRLPVTAAAVTAVGDSRCRLVHPRLLGGGRRTPVEAAVAALDLASAALQEQSGANFGVGVCDGGDVSVVAVQSEAGPMWLEVPHRPDDLYAMAEDALTFVATAVAR